jgi:spore coat polysaccharide biosynthesis protein SpsF
MVHQRVAVQVLIQARMGSTRFPGKILSRFVENFTVLEWIIQRARQSRYAERIVVATTTNPKDDETVAVCRNCGCDYARGSEEDVLGRFVAAAQIFPCRVVSHITADNPLVDISEMDRLLAVLDANGLDYANNHPAGLPLGTGTEVFLFEALLRMEKMTNVPYDREHVTPYFYDNPSRFRQVELAPTVPHRFASKVRLTLDTPEDLLFLRKLAEGLNLSVPECQPETGAILDFLELHPDLLEINREIRQKTFPTRNRHVER